VNTLLYALSKGTKKETYDGKQDAGNKYVSGVTISSGSFGSDNPWNVFCSPPIPPY